jgi:MFS family permease
VAPAHLACRIGARAQAGERNAWPRWSHRAGVVRAGVLGGDPGGLLADISGQLRVSIRTGGLMVVVPAVAAAVAAPLLALCSARLERRRVLVGLSALVLVSDVIAGLAPGIGVMLAARAVQEKRPANTLKSAVRGHTEAAAREELPCPTRL